MTAVPNIDRLRREISPGTPLEQLAGASVLADSLRVRGDELLDSYVEAARTGGASCRRAGR